VRFSSRGWWCPGAPSPDGSLALEDTQVLVAILARRAAQGNTKALASPITSQPTPTPAPPRLNGADLAARGPLTSVSLVCLVASEPVACRSGA
jgi:hypothetical protein